MLIIWFAVVLMPRAFAQVQTLDSSGAVAIVRGRVVSLETGTPISHAFVSLWPTEASPTSTTTDSDGQYEIRVSEPGFYVPAAGKPGFISSSYKRRTLSLKLGQQMTDIDFALAKAAVISGAVLDDDGEPAVGAAVQAIVRTYHDGRFELHSRGQVVTDDRGQYRLYNLAAGQYYLQANGRDRRGQQSSQLRAIYRNAPHLQEGDVLRVTAGEELPGINLALRDTPTHSISGAILDQETGEPMRGCSVSVNPEDQVVGSSASARTQSDGTFTAGGLLPGLYRVSGTQSDRANRGQTEAFFRYVEVEEGDISGLMITAGPGAAITGRVQPADGVVSQGNVDIKLISRFGDHLSLFTEVRSDGTFHIPNVQPGRYEIIVASRNGRAPEFAIASVAVGGQDLRDREIVVSEGARAVELSVTLTDSQSSVAGHTLDSAAHPASGVTVLMISANPDKRPLARYLRRTVSGRDGTFRIAHALAGEYYLIAWPTNDGREVLDSEVFRSVNKYAVLVTVPQSGSVEMDLVLGDQLRAIAASLER